MFKEKTTEEIYQIIDEAQGELEKRKKEEKIEYVLEITKYVNSKREEGLMWGRSNLDELIENIEEKVERMRPLELSDEERRIMRGLSQKKSSYKNY